MFNPITRMLRHMAWADQELRLVITNANAYADNIGKLLAHIIAAEHIWLSRIHARDTKGLTPWSALSLQQCLDLSATNVQEYTELVESLSPPDLEKVINYQTMKGDEMNSQLGDILLHVALHGSYHRGQISALLKNNSVMPPSTDYIVYCR